MKCVSYTRTMPWKNHTGELTIADQNQRIAEYLAEHKEMDLQKKYSDRKGVENASAAFDKMIDDGAERKFDCIIVASMYYCGPGFPAARQSIKETLYETGVDLIVLEEGLDTRTASRKEVEDYFEEKRCEMHAEIMFAWRKKQGAGFRLTNSVPYGYIRRNGESNMVKDEEVAPYLSEVFSRYASGQKMGDIAKWLNEQNVEPPMRHKKRIQGKPYEGESDLWTSDNLRGLFRNPTYTGATANGSRQIIAENCHEPYMTKEQFYALPCNMQQSENKISTRKKYKKPNTYFDNGFTGTNFKRPAFTRLMNDVRQKKIKCIVVKDLSRFGRNYLEAGYYIETVFPFLGVRLIAVTDHFDSTRKEDMESLALPIRNMVNTMYAKDISKKVWTSLQRKKEAGYAVGSDAPFGYIRNPVTKRNEIDPETAFYVQLIFQWVLMGVAIFEIARRLTLLKVPTPREWHRKIVEGKEVVTYKKWGETSVRHMLANQTYVGDTINNKSTQRFFAGQDKRDLSKEQWYVAKNTHPAIIARDDFEKVQEILTKNQKVFKTVRAESEQIRTEYQNDLAGMVFCADCGRSMDFDRLPHGAEESKKVCYYICRARQADDKCIGHQITEKLLKALVMDQLHLFIVRLSDKRKVLEELRKIEDMQNPVYRAKSEIMSLTDKVSQMAKKREQLYADYVAGVVDSEDYQLIREDYSKQYDGLRAALQRAEAKKVEVEQQIREYLNMTSNLEEHLDDFGFDAQLVKSLVQRIEVSADKRIRIVFGFQDVFADLGKESAGK